jgi:hypothetical protein
LRFEDRGILGRGERYLRSIRLSEEGVKKLAEDPETTGRRWTDIEEQYALAGLFLQIYGINRLWVN